MNVKFAIDLGHHFGVDEDQDQEGIDRTLLCKPETQTNTADVNFIECVNQRLSNDVIIPGRR